MTILNREGLLAALAVRFQEVTLPTGGVVRVRTLQAGERIDLGSKSIDAEGKVNAAQYSARLVAACVVDEAGAPLFSGDDVDALLRGSSEVFEAIFAAAQAINGMGSKGDSAGN